MSPRSEPLERIEVVLPDDRRVAARVRVSSRARNARIRIDPEGGVELVVPAGMRRRQASAALEGRAGWIAAKLGEMARRRERAGVLGLDRPGVVWVAGRALPIRREAAGRAIARRVGDELLVAGPDPAGAAGAVDRWYRRAARETIEPIVVEEGRRLGVLAQRISVRDPRSRWGSCSSTGTLSFSWRLVIAPEPVLRYVVVHELVHLRVPSHSPVFWQALGVAMPDWRSHADWLRDHGDELQRFQVRAPET